jgi:hypothetical protein
MTGVKIAAEGLQIRFPGTVDTSITLTSENSAGIAKYSQLIGWTEADLTNCLLTEILELFATDKCHLSRRFQCTRWFRRALRRLSGDVPSGDHDRCHPDFDCGI